MLQQTGVSTVAPYFERWMDRFGDVAALADATEDEVLHAWQGLGYYSRARSLHKAAQVVATEHGGRVPNTVDGLLALPGIGRYSAGAIASIAYGARAAVVDGNVVRVLCRVFGLRGDPAKSPLSNTLWEAAERLLPKGEVSDFNQALMELGATVCHPKAAPECVRCPLRKRCAAHLEGTTALLPELAKKKKPQAVHMVAAIVWRSGKVLVGKVPETAGRWRGMWRFPSVEVAARESSEAAVRRATRQWVGREAAPRDLFHVVKLHVTRYRITLDAYRCGPTNGRLRAVACAEFAWKRPDELADLAMPKGDRAIANRVADV